MTTGIFLSGKQQEMSYLLCAMLLKEKPPAAQNNLVRSFKIGSLSLAQAFCQGALLSWQVLDELASVKGLQHNPRFIISTTQHTLETGQHAVCSHAHSAHEGVLCGHAQPCQRHSGTCCHPAGACSFACARYCRVQTCLLNQVLRCSPEPAG